MRAQLLSPSSVTEAQRHGFELEATTRKIGLEEDANQTFWLPQTDLGETAFVWS